LKWKILQVSILPERADIFKCSNRVIKGICKGFYEEPVHDNAKIPLVHGVDASISLRQLRMAEKPENR
jgi:hypothetical protein